ncbi:hypothetical protein Plhal304r1_c018g0063971 [Plasmopara halstedii]
MLYVRGQAASGLDINFESLNIDAMVVRIKRFFISHEKYVIALLSSGTNWI